MSWTATLLRAALILGILYWLLDLTRWPVRIREAQLALWRRLGSRSGARQALRRLATHAVAGGDSAAVVEMRREIIESGLQARTPLLPFDVFHLASLLVRCGRFDEAAEWFAELDRCTFDDYRLKPAILVGMAYDLSYLGRYEEAEAALQRASTLAVSWDQWQQRRRLRSRTFRWDLAMAHGQVAWLAERYEDARRWYQSALSLSTSLARPKRLASLHNLASTALQLGEQEEAERCVDEVNRLAGSEPWPGRDRFRLLTGDLRLAQGRVQEALELVSGVVALRGAKSGALLSMTEIAYRERRFDEANAYLVQIRTDPVDARTRRRLAEALERMADFDDAAGRPAEAEERRRRALALQKPPTPASLPEDRLLGQVR